MAFYENHKRTPPEMPKKQLTFVNLSMEELASAIQEEETVLVTWLVGEVCGSSFAGGS